MSKLLKKVLTNILIFFVVALLLPLSWVFFVNITIDWAALTEEWYKIMLSPFVSSLLIGFVAFLLVELWKTKSQQHEIRELIAQQKKVASSISLICNLYNVKTFLSNHNNIVHLQGDPLYLKGIVKGEIIIEQMHFYISHPTNDILRNKAEKDIKEFCQNYIM